MYLLTFQMYMEKVRKYNIFALWHNLNFFPQVLSFIRLKYLPFPNLWKFKPRKNFTPLPILAVRGLWPLHLSGPIHIVRKLLRWIFGYIGILLADNILVPSTT